MVYLGCQSNDSNGTTTAEEEEDEVVEEDEETAKNTKQNENSATSTSTTSPGADTEGIIKVLKLLFSAIIKLRRWGGTPPVRTEEQQPQIQNYHDQSTGVRFSSPEENFAKFCV